MSKTDIRLRQDEIADVVPRFKVGPVLFTRPCGGTANASLIVITPSGQYFLKRRNPRYCDPRQLVYDHHVLKALYDKGLPVPQALTTPSASRWVEHSGHIYELYRFIEGTVHPSPNIAQVAEAGAVLAHFHSATADLKPPGKKFFGRFWDPKQATEMLEKLLQRAKDGDIGSVQDLSAGAVVEVLEYLLAEAAAVEQALPDSAFWALPQTVIHGDWHPANLKFADGRVAGIFDFDWVDRQPRMVDIADGVIYLCGLRPPSEGEDDIWTLTATPEFNWPRMRVFFSAYAASHPPADAELAALPHLIAARWIYARVDAADRKIPEADQLRFVLRNVTSPLAWLHENRAALTKNGWWL